MQSIPQKTGFHHVRVEIRNLVSSGRFIVCHDVLYDRFAVVKNALGVCLFSLSDFIGNEFAFSVICGH